MQYVVPVETVYGDRYIFGPFPEIPTYEEMLAHMAREINSDEADLHDEEIGDFQVYEFGPEFQAISIQRDSPISILRR